MMPRRDLNTNPFTPDEERVITYWRTAMPNIDCGDDPIGLLIGSHMSFRMLVQDIGMSLQPDMVPPSVAPPPAEKLGGVFEFKIDEDQIQVIKAKP